VFRAFSTAAYAFDAGAARVLPAGEIEEALALGRRFPGSLLAGERHARKLPGFDAGNSPTEIRALDLRGRVLVHTTHAGTQGLVNASGADEVLTGAFVNISAVCRYIQSRGPERVSLVRMGLRLLLLGQPAPLAEVRERLRNAPAAVKFFDPAADWAPLEDFDYCTDVDRFDFVLRLKGAADAPRELERLPAA
jgi:2-phosphosulfolactate phosphatase